MARGLSIMQTLAPLEILSLILSHLNSRDLSRLARVNRQHHSVVQPMALASVVPDVQPSVLPPIGNTASVGERNEEEQHAAQSHTVTDKHLYEIIKGIVKRPDLDTYRIGVPPPWHVPVYESLRNITLLALDLTYVSLHDPGFVLNVALQLEDLLELRISGLRLSLDGGFKYRDMHGTPSGRALGLRLQSFTLLAHAQSATSTYQCSYLKGLLAVFPNLRSFTLSYPSLALPTLQNIIYALKPHAAQLQHLGFAVLPNCQYIFRSIDWEGFTVLKSLAIPAAFLYWDYLGKHANPSLLPISLERLQLQVYETKDDRSGLRYDQALAATESLFDQEGRLQFAQMKWFGLWDSGEQTFNDTRRQLRLGSLQRRGMLYQMCSFEETPAMHWKCGR